MLIWELGIMSSDTPLTADYVLQQIAIWNWSNVLRFEHFTLHYIRHTAQLRIEEYCPEVMATTGLLARLPADMRRAVLAPMCCRVVEISSVDQKYLTQPIASVPEFARFLQYAESLAIRDGCNPNCLEGRDISFVILFVSLGLDQDYEEPEIMRQWQAQWDAYAARMFFCNLIL